MHKQAHSNWNRDWHRTCKHATSPKLIPNVCRRNLIYFIRHSSNTNLNPQSQLWPKTNLKISHWWSRCLVWVRFLYLFGRHVKKSINWTLPYLYIYIYIYMYIYTYMYIYIYIYIYIPAQLLLAWFLLVLFACFCHLLVLCLLCTWFIAVKYDCYSCCVLFPYSFASHEQRVLLSCVSLVLIIACVL